MKRFPDLTSMFIVVAVIEAIYALAGIFTPPSMVATMPGWVLSADGQWLAKLMGVALGSQAMIAFALRRNPPVAVAWALAFYQVGSATVDWVMWLVMKDEGIFSVASGRLGVIISIPLHTTIGLLMVAAILRAPREAAGR